MVVQKTLNSALLYSWSIKNSFMSLEVILSLLNLTKSSLLHTCLVLIRQANLVCLIMAFDLNILYTNSHNHLLYSELDWYNFWMNCELAEHQVSVLGLILIVVSVMNSDFGIFAVQISQSLLKVVLTFFRLIIDFGTIARY